MRNKNKDKERIHSEGQDRFQSRSERLHYQQCLFYDACRLGKRPF